MDGTYGNYLPASRTMSPTVPPTSSGADRYKVNVSRQKTQKWANFKPQNYGDGWGDDDDDEWDEPEPQMPQKPMGPRQPPTVPSSSSSSFLPSQVPHRIVTAASSTGSLGSLGSLPSQSQQSLVSPGGSATSPTKPPFVRPADIYKRLEDEKRKSLEATRPNVANITGDKEVAPSEPARYTLSDSEPKASHHAGQVADVARGLNAGLATVPESRSEYGLEGPLDSYGTGEINTNIGPSRGPPFSPSAGTNSQAPNVIQHPNDSQSQPGVELRRFSSSPQLPLVTRLSGFGEDLFSPSTFQTDSTQQPIIQTGSPTGIAQNPSLGPLAKAEPGSDKQISLRVSGDLSKSDAGPSATDTTIRSRSPPNEPEQSIGSQDGSTAAQPLGNWPTQQQQRAVDPPREPASNTGMDDKALPNRPSLPGSWVTETPSTPGNALIAAKTEPAREASPVNQIDAATVSTPDADRSRQPSPARVGEASETTSVKQEAASLPSTLPPPLRTSSPTTNTKSDMLRDYKSWERGVSPEKTGTATKSNPAPSFGLAQNRDITPIAPLNTRRDAPEVSTDVQPVLSPPSNGTEPSLETDAISPLKENDMLSQEILESLSPVQSSENFVPINGATTSAYQAAAEQSAEDPGRESSYLGDVYDDYWAAGEEKDSQAVVESKEVREHNDSPPPVHSAAASTTTPPLNPTQISIAANVVPIPSNEKTPTAPATTASAAEDSRRRFSWEAAFSDPEPVVTQLTATPPLSEPKSLGSGLSHAGSTPNVGGSAPSLVSSAGVKSDAPPAPGAMSHQVSQASPLAARSASDPAEPPSPISIVSEQQGKRSSPAPEAQRKLSVADPFKGASPAALLPEDEMTPKASVPRAPSPKTPLNILPFRHIMEMGSSTERIQQFDEARLQFAAIDTGLEEWLASMVSKHPEHSTGGFGASREALHLPTGQPAHFQQAGHVNSAGIQANIPMPPLQQHGTAFGHLHGSNQVNQVGTKSKELLMAAGKAGKGLFSKGRNKLRGTGDKVFST